MTETPRNADTVAADLSLLWQAARVSPHLRTAVERVEDALRRAAQSAESVRPLRPGENPLADQLIEENDRLRRERNQWVHEAERIKREYDNLVASLGDLIHTTAFDAGDQYDGDVSDAAL